MTTPDPSSGPVADFPANPCPLETPGSIAVIGGGSVGIEAALYGRYLGYDVRVYEAATVGHRWLENADSSLPMMPARSFSPLAASALAAQSDDRPETLPVTAGGWVEGILRPLTETDLLRGRIEEGRRVVNISLVTAGAEQTETADPADPTDSGDEDDEGLPPDFRLLFGSETAESAADAVVVEAVLIATGGRDVPMEFGPRQDYLWNLRAGETGNAADDLAIALDRIRAVFATLSDRADLDLYGERRGLV